jgi:hypothetical protein
MYPDKVIVEHVGDQKITQIVSIGVGLLISLISLILNFKANNQVYTL